MLERIRYLYTNLPSTRVYTSTLGNGKLPCFPHLVYKLCHRLEDSTMRRIFQTILTDRCYRGMMDMCTELSETGDESHISMQDVGIYSRYVYGWC